MYCEANKQQCIYILAEHKNTYLDFFDKPLGSALYPGRLLGLGELFVTDEVVPTLAPHENVLATILGAPLDLLHLVVGGRLGLLTLHATPSRGNRYHRTLTPTRGALWRRSLRLGGVGALLSSAGRGVGALSPSSATLLGGGVLAASSSLTEVLALILA